MFSWVDSLIVAPWSRRTRWTPLLQNQREFQRTLSKERLRVDRGGSRFGCIILRLSDFEHARRQTVKLAKLLHRRLRETDERGHLGYGRLGVMLPDTGNEGTEFVLQDILRLAGEQGVRIEGEAFVYPDSANGLGDGAGLPGQKQSGSVEDTPALTPASFARVLSAPPRWKRGLDIVGSVIGLILCAPIVLLLALLIKLSNGGPILFCQQRTGLYGKPFTIYKLRTMVVNAEQLQTTLQEKNERDGPAFKMRRDPRITRLGKFLRSTGLDELPQLWNVLNGDMSLVGPRPLPIEEADQCLAWQQRRHDVKPGLTCFWQLAKSRKISFATWMRLDLKYARRFSLGLDVKLIVRTFLSMFLGRVGH